MDRFVYVKIIESVILFVFIFMNVLVFKIINLKKSILCLYWIKYGIYMNVWYNVIIKCCLFVLLIIKERIVMFFNVIVNKVYFYYFLVINNCILDKYYRRK